MLEILLAIALGSLLVEIVLQSYLSAKNIYQAQNDLTYLDGNIRFAEFFLWQNIMQADFVGWRKTAELNLVNQTHRTIGIRGYDSMHLPQHLANSSVVAETDIIVIGKAKAEAISISEDVASNALSVAAVKKFTTEGSHHVLISDGKSAHLFAAANWGAKKVRLLKEFNHTYRKNNTKVRVFEEMTFYIGSHLNGEKRPIHSLYLCINGSSRKEELISDVTDMQIQYGVNINGVYQYLKASFITDPELWDRVSSVIIDLKFRSNLLTKQKRLYIKLRERN